MPSPGRNQELTNREGCGVTNELQGETQRPDRMALCYLTIMDWVVAFVLRVAGTEQKQGRKVDMPEPSLAS